MRLATHCSSILASEIIGLSKSLLWANQVTFTMDEAQDLVLGPGTSYKPEYHNRQTSCGGALSPGPGNHQL